MKTMIKGLGIALFAAMLVFVSAGCKEPDSDTGTGTNTGGPTGSLPVDNNVISIYAIQGVTVPATGGTPVTAITANAQYSGTVTWKNADGIALTGNFAASTVYTATISLTAKTGYTMQGLAANVFTVAGTTSVSNSANSGVITAVFPVTASSSGNSTRSITIEMYDSAGNGWDGNGALRINVNGVDIANNVKVQNGSNTTYTFNVTTDDVVQLYWVEGDYQSENSFVVYYTDTWDGSNALISKDTLEGISGGTLLGSFTVSGGNIVNDTVVNISAIQGVTVPVTDGTPVSSITENAQYSGTVTWKNADGITLTGNFAASTVYTATITLTAKTGYTLQGVSMDFFSVAGTTSVSNSANSGVITAVFPVTASSSGNSTRSITIDMYDSYGDGWDGNGALRINVNGVDIADNVKVQNGYNNTYTFDVTAGDVVQLFWIEGTNQSENSFFVYYTDTGNGSNALISKDTMEGISGGTLLGSFTVSSGNIVNDTVINISAIQGVTVPVTGGTPVSSITENAQYSGTVTWSPNHSTFAAATQYTATITLIPKEGYTLEGVYSYFFNVAGATSVSNSADSGVITAMFSATAANVIDMSAVQGVTPPATGVVPVTSITENAQYSGTVTWSPNHSTFAAETVYTATITLTPKEGYTLEGVGYFFFSVAGATSVINYANSGVITATFPYTKTVTPASRIEYYWVDRHDSLVTTSGGATTVAAGATLTITAQSAGYTVKQWHLNGVNTGQSGNTYNFSSVMAGKHTVGLFVEKDGRLYNTNIIITVNGVTVTYDVNGGSGTTPTAQTVDAGYSITLPSGSGLYRTGYTFGGWNTGPSGTGTNYAAGSSYTPTGNITLYARWISTVTFSANNGYGTVPALQTAPAGSSITLPNGSELQREGYTFGGWNISANGTGTDYKANSFYTPTGNITLYAKWITDVTVTFSINSGTGTVPASQTVVAGSSITLPNGNGFSQGSYTFGGWNTSSAGTGTNYNAGDTYVVLTSNVTLYARWNSTVTFSINNGTGTAPASQTVPAGSSITLPDGNGFTRNNYDFLGWNAWATGMGTNYSAGSSYTPTGNTTLYAKWNYIYTVTFDINGSDTGTTPSAQSSSTTITLPNGSEFSRSGYVFLGWNTEAKGGGTNYGAGSSYTVTAAITLYARWIISPTQLPVNTFFASNGSITPDGEYFKFTATAASQYIHVRFGTLTDLSIQLYDSNGNKIGAYTNLYGSTGSTQYIFRTVTVDHEYYIEVKKSLVSGYTYYIAFNTSSTF
jgi:uncharacterized repeat protein (TIGR02543 family)